MLLGGQRPPLFLELAQVVHVHGVDHPLLLKGQARLCAERNPLAVQVGMLLH